MDPNITEFQMWQALLRDDEYVDIVKTDWGHHAIVDDGVTFSMYEFDKQGRMLSYLNHAIPNEKK